jgi:hypothetical protein
LLGGLWIVFDAPLREIMATVLFSRKGAKRNSRREEKRK